MSESYITPVPPPPPPPPVTTPAPVTMPTALQIQATTKAAAMYSAATTDSQSAGKNTEIQGKYNMTRPELERAVKQLDDQVNNPRVMTSEQAETQEWDFTGRSKNNTRVNFSLIGSKDELKGLNSLNAQHRQAEMATRAGIAMSTYSTLKAQGQDVSRIEVKRSPDDPQRYNVIIDTPDGMGGTKQQELEHVNPNRLDLLPKKMEIGRGSSQKEAPLTNGGTTPQVIGFNFALNIFNTSGYLGISIVNQAAREKFIDAAARQGVLAVVVTKSEDCPVPFLAQDEFKMIGDKLPKETTVVATGLTEESAENEADRFIEDTSKKYDQSVADGDEITEYHANIDGNGNATAKAKTESGKELNYKGNINDEEGLKLQDPGDTEGQDGLKGTLPKSTFNMPGDSNQVQSAESQQNSGLSDMEAQQHLINLMQIIADSMKELGNKLEEIYRAAAEKSKIGDEKAQKRRDAQKQVDKKAAEKSQEAERSAQKAETKSQEAAQSAKIAARKSQAADQLAKNLENTVAMGVNIDPVARQHLGIKAIHERQKARKG